MEALSTIFWIIACLVSIVVIYVSISAVVYHVVFGFTWKGGIIKGVREFLGDYSMPE